jgi:diphthamide synthase (EF-2-diphthine--ammonia ligase)
LEAAVLVILICNRTKIGKIKYVPPHHKSNFTFVATRPIVLVNQMLENIVTMIVSCNTMMGEQYLGKILTKELAQELHRKGIDPCGENGEFHTLVLNCPFFWSD